jgi:uncharacterized membrane protein YjjP (DUF1212 family)
MLHELEFSNSHSALSREFHKMVQIGRLFFFSLGGIGGSCGNFQYTDFLPFQDFVKIFIDSFMIMTVGKPSKYRNMLFTQIIKKPSAVYHISKDSEKFV